MGLVCEGVGGMNARSCHADVVCAGVSSSCGRSLPCWSCGRLVAGDLGVSEATVYRWIAQDEVDLGERSGVRSGEQQALSRARARIRELEAELELTRKASALFEEREGRPAQKGLPGDREPGRAGTQREEALPDAGRCAVGFFYWRSRPPTMLELRTEHLGGLIADIHHASRGTYGTRRVTAELRLGYGLTANRRAVRRIMRSLGLQGLPLLKAKREGPRTDGAAAGDLVLRQFSRDAPDRLWLTDITEHPTREGKLYCCVVLDAFSRSIVGWSIDSQQAASLVMSIFPSRRGSRSPTCTTRASGSVRSPGGATGRRQRSPGS
jgi:putative transposase